MHLRGIILQPLNTHSVELCGSRKYPYSPQGLSMEIPKGREVSIAQIFKRKYEAKLEVPGGGRVQTKEPSVGEAWIFLEPHIGQ